MQIPVFTGANSGIGQSAAVQITGRGVGVIRTNHGDPAGASTRTRIAGDPFARSPEAVPAKTALGRIGEPADVGTLIAALLSRRGRWITAQNTEVSGGFNL